MKILVEQLDGLIGDFLGAVPSLQALAKDNEVYVKYHPEIKELFEMTGLKDWVQLIDEDLPDNQPQKILWDKLLNSNCGKAFDYATRHGNLHMTQAFFGILGLPVPDKPVKAKLEFVAAPYEVSYDYIVAPFSRSLLKTPQLWDLNNFLRLAEIMPDKTFCMIGHERDLHSIHGPADGVKLRGNLYTCIGRKFADVMQLMKQARQGLISVVSGPSHLAYHLGVKNLLLTNQNMNWGVNPDAIKIEKWIPKLTPEEVRDILLQNENK